MKKHLWSLILLLIVLSACHLSPQPELSPPEVVTKFYRWYIGYPGNPLVDKEYRHSPYLADSFIQQVDQTLAAFDRGSADPILLAQDIPESFTVNQTTVDGERATVMVHFFWSGNPTPSERQVDLKLIDGAWKITTISITEK